MNDMSTSPTNDATDTKIDPEDQKVDDAALEEEQSAEEIWNEFEEQDDFDPADPPSRSLVDNDEEPETQDDPLPEDGADADTTPAEPTDAEPPDPAEELERLRAENQRLRGTVSGQGRKIQSLISERTRLTERVTAAQDDDAEAREQAFKEAQEEYGDILGPVADTVTALKGQVETLAGQTQDRVNEIDQEIEDLSKQEFGILTDAHPDFQEVVGKNGALFNQWIEDQPKALRDIHAANKDRFVDGEGAAMIVTEFKKALAAASNGADPEPKNQNKADARRARQLDGSRTTTARTPQAATTRVDPNSDDREAHWQEFERMDAKKTG